MATKVIPGFLAGLKDQRGLTLIEIMASSIILGIAITATTTLLRLGQDLEYKRNVERQAYRLAYSALEDPVYHYWPNYHTYAVGVTNTTLNSEGRSIEAVVTVTPYAEAVELWAPYNSTAWKRIDAKVRWTLEGSPDSVVASKIVAEVR